MASETDGDAARAALGPWDVVSIMVGIVVGAGIYETPPLVLQNVAGPWQAMGVWAVGGVLSLVGALCLAELAAAYPRSGGDYVYLTRAFGPWLGFLFAWFQLAAIRAANVAMMAFVFADYAAAVWDVPFARQWAWAAAAVAVLAVLNLLGVVFGRRTQNLLTLAKVLGLGGVLAAGFGWPQTAAAVAAPTAGGGSLATAMVLVLLTYGGWNDAAFVAAEVRGGPRAVARSLLAGTAAITLLYLLLNAAYLWGLGFDAARDSHAIAADLAARPLGPWGGKAIALLVMVSALGAINGMLFSGARIYASLGAEHAVFRRLGRAGTALLVQAAVSLGLVGVIGTPAGRHRVDACLGWLHLEAVAWEGHGGFEVLAVATTPLFWLFFLLCGLALFALRQRDPHLERPFAVPLYPELPLIFCCLCVYMIYAGLAYAERKRLLGGLLLLAGFLAVVGLGLFRLSQRMGRRAKRPE